MECHKLTDGENGIDCNRVDELCIKQDEADTLMLLIKPIIKSDIYSQFGLKL